MLRGLPEGVVSLRDQWLSSLFIENDARVLRARLDADGRMQVRRVLHILNLHLLVGLLPHGDLLRELGSAISLPNEARLLLKDLQGLLITSLLLLQVVHVDAVLAFVQLVELISDCNGCAPQWQAHLHVAGQVRPIVDWIEAAVAGSRGRWLDKRWHARVLRFLCRDRLGLLVTHALEHE